MSVTIPSEEIDAAKRQLAQVKDLAYGPKNPEVRARVLDLHHQGFRPARIGRTVGLSLKQAICLLVTEGIRRPAPRPAEARLLEIQEVRRQGDGFAARLDGLGELLGCSPVEDGSRTSFSVGSGLALAFVIASFMVA